MSFMKKSGAMLAGSRALLEASADDLRVLLCLLENGELSGEALAKAAGCFPARAEAAIAYWRASGVLTASQGAVSDYKVGVRPADELSSIVDRRMLGELIDECQKLLSHTFNQTEISVIAGLCEDYCLDGAYILSLLAYCIEIGKGSVKYMEKTALSLVDSGIETLAALDEYLKRRRNNAGFESEVRRLFGIGSRALTKKEIAYCAEWQSYGYGIDVVGLAYDITVNATGKASLAYAAKILTSWHDAGAKTLADCEAAQNKTRESRAPKKPAASLRKKKEAPELQSFDTEDFFKKALERSYGRKD